jgi:hypothetical protein
MEVTVQHCDISGSFQMYIYVDVNDWHLQLTDINHCHKYFANLGSTDYSTMVYFLENKEQKPFCS